LTILTRTPLLSSAHFRDKTTNSMARLKILPDVQNSGCKLSTGMLVGTQCYLASAGYGTLYSQMATYSLGHTAWLHTHMHTCTQ